MSIEEKVVSAETAIQTLLSLVTFCMEHKKFIIDTCEDLFKVILAKKDLAEKQIENEIDIVIAGILVSAFSLHQSKYQYLNVKQNSLSPYLWDEHGDIKSPYYPKQFKEVLALSDVGEPTNEAGGAYNERLVLAVGAKVMNGELPFQPEILNEIFDSQTQVAYERCFEARQPTLLNNITTLKERVSVIATKINQTLHNKPIENNALENSAFKLALLSHTCSIILVTVIGAIIGMLVGAAIGFAVGGGIPGVIIGGVVGLVGGGGIAAMSCTMWYAKKDSMALDATEVFKIGQV